MARHRSYSRSRSRSRSPPRRKRYDDPRGNRRDRRSPGPTGLLVRNISLSARPEDLRVPFERYGPVKDVYLPKNYHTGEPRGFGFVKFRYSEDAAEAKSHLNHTVIGGREIRIVFAEENRKTPQEMRRITRTSSRGSHRRRSPSLSPRRRYHSHSRSPSPARHDSRVLTLFDSKYLGFLKLLRKCSVESHASVTRDRGHRARDNNYSPRRSKSPSQPISPRDDKVEKSRERGEKSHERSRRHSRSISRSVSPHDEKNHRPRRRSPSPPHDEKNHRPHRQSPSPPHDEKNHRHHNRSPSPPHGEKNHRAHRRSPSPRKNGQTEYSPSRSQSPGRNSKSPARSPF